MIDDGNSVNMKSAKRSYHHGDLRAALVAEGLNLLAQSDAEHLSLREIARNVGVSATAVYRHFPDKQALLGALCAEGDRQLAAAQRIAQEAAGGGRAGLDATGRAYVRFALANPALFRLMTGAFGRDADYQSEGQAMLRENISALAGKGADAEQLRDRRIAAWAMVHGLAMLMLDGQIPADAALVDRIIG